MAYPDCGAKAPDFCLQNQDNQPVTLGKLVNRRVVLYFYPRAMTPGCTTQACGLRDSRDLLGAANTVVLGISPDPVAALRKFADKNRLNFDLLSDPDHQIAETYGVWQLKKFMGKEFMGVVRTTFIIDESGVLVRVMNKFKTTTHHADLLQALQALDNGRAGTPM